LSTVEGTLRCIGYQVVATADAAEAGRRIENTRAPRIDILLTDVFMPCITGVAVASVAHQLHPGMRVVFMSGEPVAAQAHGAADTPVLRKSFTSRELLDRLEQLG